MKVINPETQDKIIRLICALIPHTKIYRYDENIASTKIAIILDTGAPLAEMVLNEVRYVLKDNHIPDSFEVLDYYKLSSDVKKAVDKERYIWKN